MKKIDIFNHVCPPAFLERISDLKDIGKRMREVPMLHDLDERFRVMDRFPGYVQVLAAGMPPIEALVGPTESPALARLCNDGLADMCDRHPERFPTFLASLPLNNPDACVDEIHRAVKDLGARAVQIYSNVGGKPLDLPEFEPIFDTMAELDLPLFLHPQRGANFPDYLTEPKSKYEMWWTFGWPYETSVAMARLVFSKVLDRYPRLKFIPHHFGAMVPFFEGRVGPGWDQLGKRTSDEDYFALRKSLNMRPLDYFKRFFWADTAVFGSRAATVCGIDFYGADHVVFASDCPFDPEGGRQYIRETLKIIDGLDISQADREKIYFRNIEKLTGRSFSK
jgi:uncharacterized protein